MKGFDTWKVDDAPTSTPAIMDSSLRPVVPVWIIACVLLGSASAQVEQPKPKPLASSSVLDGRFFIERLVHEAAKAHGDVVIRRTNILLTQEPPSPGLEGQTDHTFSLQFIRNARLWDPLPVPGPLILDVIRRAETAEDSPWKLTELRMTAQPGDLWIIERLAFSRSEGQAASERIAGHVALDALAAARQASNSADARIAETRIELRAPARDREGIFDVEFSALGTGFASGYKRFRDAMADVCSQEAGPFRELRDLRGPEPLNDSKEPGSSYRLVLGLRVSTRDPKPDEERVRRDEARGATGRRGK